MSEQIIEEIKEKLADDEELFNELCEELDSWNGYLGDDRYYPMDELYELNQPISQNDFDNLMNRIYYGHDEDSCTYDNNGNKNYDAFNPNRDWFKYDGYGNLVSTDYKEYPVTVDELIDEVVEHYYDIDIDDVELDELFEELVESEN